MSIIFLILAIFALGVLVVIHEAGHMWVARWSGMRVERFSVGFGPVLKQWGGGTGTVYQIAAIPLGGFVQIAGMNPHEQLPPDDAGSFENKPVGRRLATIFAGPLTNYLAAVALCGLVFSAWGLPIGEPTTGVEQVVAGKPAEHAGLQGKDRFVAIDGKPVTTPEQVRDAIQKSGGRALQVDVERKGGRARLTIAPARKPDGSYEIGVQFATKDTWEGVPPAKLPALAAVWPIRFLELNLRELGRHIARREAPPVGGPVAIVGTLRSQFQTGVPASLMSLAALNVFLAFFNLLPIPALDGGRLAFLLVQAVTRRRVSARIETAVHMVGFFLLLAMFLLVTANDIGHIFSGK